jgi:uncharacterized protein YeeX (DUF496 family)
MPYKLRKAPGKELYWVVTKETGAKHSKDPLPKARAEAQMRALYANEEPVIKTKQSDMIAEHIRIVDRLATRQDLDKEVVLQKDELKEYIEPLMEGKPTVKERKAAIRFEDDADLHMIKRAVLTTQCRKINKDLVGAMNNKQELLAYLREKQCPALIRLEAVLERTLG